MLQQPYFGGQQTVADGDWCEVLGRAGTGPAIGGKFWETLPQVATWKLLEAHTNGGRPAVWTAESSEALQQTGHRKLGVEGVLSCS
jgi:hypothetical protein